MASASGRGCTVTVMSSSPLLVRIRYSPLAVLYHSPDRLRLAYVQGIGSSTSSFETGRGWTCQVVVQWLLHYHSAEIFYRIQYFLQLNVLYMHTYPQRFVNKLFTEVIFSWVWGGGGGGGWGAGLWSFHTTVLKPSDVALPLHPFLYLVMPKCVTFFSSLILILWYMESS